MSVTRYHRLACCWLFLLLIPLLSACDFVDSAGEGVNESPTVTTSNLVVNEQEEVTLDSNSVSIVDDFDNITTYQWQQTGGEAVDLKDADTATPSFTTPVVLTKEGEKELTFSLTVTDNFGESGSGNLNVTVLPVNDLPNAVDDGASTDEGAAVDIDVVANDSDPDGTLNSGTIKIPAPPAHGTIPLNEDDGTVKLNDDGTLPYTHDGSETISDSFTYTVEDDEGAVSAPATVSITVNPINDVPQITGQTPLGVLEDQDLPISLGNLVVTDPDNVYPDDFILSVGPGSNYDLSGTTVIPDPNFNGSLTVPVRVNDGEDNSNDFNLVVNVTPVPDAPTNIGLSNSTVQEGKSVGTEVGTFSTTDPDKDDSHTYDLVSGDTGAFTISGDKLRTAQVFDFEIKSSFTVRVRSTDSDGLLVEKNFTITVQQVNESPTDISLSSTSVSEGKPIGTPVGTFSASDPDAGDSHTYTIISGDTSAFSISGNQLLTAQEFDFETKNAYSIGVRSTDSGGLFIDKQFSITILDSNEPPSFTSLPVFVGTVLSPYSYNITVTDPNAGDTLTITAPTLPSWLTLQQTENTTATLTGTPIVSGTYPVVLQVTDNGSPNLNAQQPFNIVVDAGVSINFSKFNTNNSLDCWSTPQAQLLTGTLADAQASSQATYSLVTNGTKGTVTITDPTTGQFNYLPNATGPRGEDSFDYQIEDPDSGVTTKTGMVIIQPKLMVLGDSISAGITDYANQLPPEGQRTGYRQALYEALSAAGYAVDLVGTQRAGAEIVDFDADHEAHLDWTAAEMAYGRLSDGSDGIFAWLEANPADVVLLHAGSYGFSTSPAQMAAILDEIDRWEASANGNPVTVLLARIIDQNPSNPDITVYNTNVAAVVLERTNNPAHPAYPDAVIMVDQHSALAYPEDLADALHPDASGYGKMAELWRNTLLQQQLLDKCP